MLNKFNKISKVTAVAAVAGVFGLALVANSNNANAQGLTLATLDLYSCTDSTYGQGGTYFTNNEPNGSKSGNYTSRANYTSSCETGNTSNASGAVVTATQTLRAATAQTVGLISSRISQVRSATRRNSGLKMTALSLSNDLSNGEIGLAGGNASKGVGVWAQGKFTAVDFTSVSAAFDGNILTGMFGIDKTFAGGKFLIGLGGGFETSDFETTFNRGTVESDGLIIAPYISAMFGNGFSIDATGGYANLDYDTTRKETATNELINGSTDADRFFGSMMLKYNRSKKLSKGSLTYGALLGVSYTEEEKDGFTEVGADGDTSVAVAAQTTEMGQVLFGMTTGMDFGKVEPFLNLTGEFDFEKSDDVTVGATQVAISDSDFGLRVGGGLNLRFSPRVSGLVSADSVLLRDDYSEFTGTAKIRIDF